MTNQKPFSQACENNKQPILERLSDVFDRPGTILEIGTGTGQHAVHFAQAMSHLVWQPSDHPDAVDLCRPWLADASLPNILPPVALNVGEASWPVTGLDGVFTANTAHIMAWPEVVAMFRGIGTRAAPGAAFCQYGPFNYNGEFTSASNQRFDHYLRTQASHMGIRDLAELTALATEASMVLEADYSLPANNRLLVWRRVAQS